MPTQLVLELQELIDALDRRIPHTGRAGEALIASDAAALRVDALRQIADLEADLPAIRASSSTEESTTER